jgi:hypothetical protein
VQRDSSVLVQDEITTNFPVSVVWHFLTKADVEISDGGRRARLTQGGKTISIVLQLPSKAVFTARVPSPKLITDPITGVTDVSISLSGTQGPTTIAVIFASKSEIGSSKAEPLSQWN